MSTASPLPTGASAGAGSACNHEPLPSGTDAASAREVRLGLKLLGSLGFMRGRRFPEVQEGLEESGATWQLGVGTVLGS